jgi:hypothetical protein
MAVLLDFLVNQYIVLGTELAALRTTASLSFWIKTTDAGTVDWWNSPCVAGFEEAGGADDIFWGYIPSDGTIGISKGNTPFTSTTVVNDDEWHHVVVTWDSATGAIQIIVDGVLETTDTSETGDVINTFSGLGIREHSDGIVSARYLDGSLADVRVYDRILNEAEGQTIYASNGHDNIVDFVHRWTLDDDNDGEIMLGAADRSVAPNDGTPSGVAAATFEIAGIQGGPDRFDLEVAEGDQTSVFTPGFAFTISGSAAPANNGAFTVDSSTFSGGLTSVNVNENLDSDGSPTAAIAVVPSTQPVHADSPLDVRRRVA